ncbi:hypothetical protein [Staphylococcus americanisciuri]|uniref:Uncharacterized protein n=1 Tax=Staphylococcus americanisciuri TaxID=2973940 RepID=A0ABT2F0V7_9STAP|nr:hypothetical protein [Staphylococcus americanisciuri]MCS4486083.1 hypothetical protein [Staphylococcus americanisciuri]
MFTKNIKEEINRFNKRMTCVEYALPFSSYEEYKVAPSIMYRHAITMLRDGWDCDYDQLSQSIFYTKNFEITDYDGSKDYLIDMRQLDVSGTLLINNRAVMISKCLTGVHDLTQYISESENTLIMIVKHDDMSEQLKRQLNTLYIVERANDRIVSYDVATDYNVNSERLEVQLKITDIEGAPIPTYILMDSLGQTVATGDICVDQLNHFSCTHSNNSLLNRSYYQLLIDTEDETLVQNLYIDND